MFPISLEKCKEGAELCLKKSENLFECAKIIHNNNNFGVSIALSTYAFEELAKGDMLLSHFKKNKPVSETEWRKYRYGKSHIVKLERSIRKVLSNENRKLLKGSYLTDVSIISFLNKLKLAKGRAKNTAESLKSLRELIFYTTWEKEKWETIELYYNPENLKATSISLIDGCNQQIEEFKKKLYLARAKLF